MNELTFGSTPAAKYLVRSLEGASQSVIRSIGRSITGTSTKVNEILNSYYERTMTPKTAADLLRLMRLEVSNSQEDLFVHRLCKNVQIGHIKRAIRVVTLARKAEAVMKNPTVRGISDSHKDDKFKFYNFVDKQTGTVYTAGLTYLGEEPVTNIYIADKVDMKTPELLEARSNKRCRRLNKPHMKNEHLS